MMSFLDDCRYGLRWLLKTPVVSAVAVWTLVPA